MTHTPHINMSAIRNAVIRSEQAAIEQGVITGWVYITYTYPAVVVEEVVPHAIRPLLCFECLQGEQ